MSIAIGASGSAGLIRPPMPAPAPAPAAASPENALPVKQTGGAKPDSDFKQALPAHYDPYVISDRTFVSYKDASGQMITRYVSLRDGTVTYEPTPQLTRSLSPSVIIKA